MPKPEFRVIDTGLRSGRENIAFDQAMIEAHLNGDIGDSIRFIHFQPCALVGRHQDLGRELKLGFCTDNNIQTVRRITGGGAIYMDGGQIGWALVFSRKTLGIVDLGDLAKVICQAAAAGLSRLGIKAKFRPRNDIEVNGQKIAGTGGFFDGDTVFYQGTILIDTDLTTMMAALNVPKAKLEKHFLDKAASRVTTLRELLGTTPQLQQIKQALLDGFGDKLGITINQEKPSKIEEQLTKQFYDEEIGQDEFVKDIHDLKANSNTLEGSHTGPGGTVTAFVKLEANKPKRIREVLLTGDFFITPPRLMLDLESNLRRVELSDIAAHIENFFAQAEVEMLSIKPADFAQAILNACSSS